MPTRSNHPLSQKLLNYNYIDRMEGDTARQLAEKTVEHLTTLLIKKAQPYLFAPRRHSEITESIMIIRLELENRRILTGREVNTQEITRGEKKDPFEKTKTEIKKFLNNGSCPGLSESLEKILAEQDTSPVAIKL